MLFIVMLLTLIALSLPVLFVIGLRRWGMEEAERESRLQAPQAHTVSYTIPEGQDPAVLRAALADAGFEMVVDRGGAQRLLVQCDAVDRERVRAIIEHVERTSFDGPEMHIGHARLGDDPS